MTADRHVALYRRLCRAYPRRFRAEYGADLVGLFADQLQDEPASRVWLRTVRNLVLTVPTQQLEARMHRPSTDTVAKVAAVGAITFVLMAVTIGYPLVAIPLLLLGAGGGAVAATTWRSGQPADRAPLWDAWWRFAVAGAAVLGVTLAGMAFPWPGSWHVDRLAWLLAFAGLTAGWVLLLMGALLGAIGLGWRWRTARLH